MNFSLPGVIHFYADTQAFLLEPALYSTRFRVNNTKRCSGMRKNFCQMFGYALAVGDSNFDYISVKLMKLMQ